MSLHNTNSVYGFSALQRAEIAEMMFIYYKIRRYTSFSALQRAEIAEILLVLPVPQRA